MNEKATAADLARFIMPVEAIPDRMMEQLRRYIDHGEMPCRFLCAVLENDFMGAVTQADPTNRANLKAYVVFLFNEVPGACHGSPKKVAAWCKAKFKPGRAT